MGTALFITTSCNLEAHNCNTFGGSEAILAPSYILCLKDDLALCFSSFQVPIKKQSSLPTIYIPGLLLMGVFIGE